MNTQFPGDFEKDPCPEYTDEQMRAMAQAADYDLMLAKGIKLSPLQLLEHRRLVAQGYGVGPTKN